MVLVCVVWRPQWFGARVVAHVDNEAAVAVLNSGYSREGQIMHLIRRLFLIVAYHQIWLSACHIPGTQNGAADAISWDNLRCFSPCCRWWTAGQLLFPQALMALLVTEQPDWTSAGWSQLFRNCFQLDRLIEGLQDGSESLCTFLQAVCLFPILFPILFPTSKEKLSQFVAHLFVGGLSADTVKSYLSAVHHAQIGLGLGDPDFPNMPQLEYIIKGYRRKSVKGGGRPRLPITPAILQALKVVWSLEGDSFTASMLWAASCLCFFFFSVS